MNQKQLFVLSQISNIVAVKEASGNLNNMTKIIANTSDDFELYTGDDGVTLPVLAIGGAGVISVASHVIGNEMQEMINKFLQGDLKGAAKLHQQLLPIMEGLFKAPNPVPVKTALQLKGLNVGSVRLPLVPLTEQERIKISKFIRKIVMKKPAGQTTAGLFLLASTTPFIATFTFSQCQAMLELAG